MRRLIALFAAVLSLGIVGLLAPVAAPGAGASVTAPRGVVPGSWQIVTTAMNTSFNGVSCVGPMFCLTVGDTPTGPQAATWDGSAWHQVSGFAVQNGAADLMFEGVSCVTPSWCLAVGRQANSSHFTVPLAETWNGSTWASVPTPNPVTSSFFTGASCTSTTFCEVVGLVDGGGAVLQQWNGSGLTAQNPPNGVGVGSFLKGVDCIAKWCMAVGLSNTQALALSYNGAWAVSPLGAVAPNGQLDGVSCATTTMCVAVGDQPSGPTTSNLVEQWNGKTNTWHATSAPSASPAFGDGLNSVSCLGPTSCVAGGFFYTDNTSSNFLSEIDAWNGSAWSLQNAPVPALSTEDDINGVDCITNDRCFAVGFADSTVQILSAPITRPGYTEVAADGGLFNFGGAGFFGSIGGHALNAPVVAMAATPDGGGYWEVATDGGIFAYGDAGYFGSMGGKPLNKPIVSMVPTMDGRGYWLIASDGGIFNFGDAPFYGSMGGKPLNKPIVAIAAAPSGLGYYEVASDGGLFAFGLPGQAPFLGSTGNIAINSPIVGMAVTNQGGYYEVAKDGGLFAFGGAKAPFKGSMGGKALNAPIVGMAVEASGGYYEVASDGGIFNFGGAPFHGSMGGKALVEPIVGIAT
jgi:hypothetical protein